MEQGREKKYIDERRKKVDAQNDEHAEYVNRTSRQLEREHAAERSNFVQFDIPELPKELDSSGRFEHNDFQNRLDLNGLPNGAPVNIPTNGPEIPREIPPTQPSPGLAPLPDNGKPVASTPEAPSQLGVGGGRFTSLPQLALASGALGLAGSNANKQPVRANSTQVPQYSLGATPRQAPIAGKPNQNNAPVGGVGDPKAGETSSKDQLFGSRYSDLTNAASGTTRLTQQYNAIKADYDSKVQNLKMKYRIGLPDSDQEGFEIAMTPLVRETRATISAISAQLQKAHEADVMAKELVARRDLVGALVGANSPEDRQKIAKQLRGQGLEHWATIFETARRTTDAQGNPVYAFPDETDPKKHILFPISALTQLVMAESSEQLKFALDGLMKKEEERHG